MTDTRNVVGPALSNERTFSADVGVYQPDPQIFRLALEQLILPELGHLVARAVKKH